MKYTYVANWKMNISYQESLNYCTDNKQELKKLSEIAEIILCPSFISLVPIVEILKDTTISIGAQNCSEYSSGSYTGEISAALLAEISVNYCVVGHNERRVLYGETTEAIVKKIGLLLDNNIQPIICIGETKEHFQQNATLTVLTEQLKPILASIQSTNKSLMIAYEPAWAINSGIIPENNYLEEVFRWIKKTLTLHSTPAKVQLLYGGSITEKNIASLKKIVDINGFLVGVASTYFEEFNKIIEL